MGKSSKQPSHTTQTTTSEYPTELKPFIQDIFGKAKGVSDQRAADGYQPYNAPRVAEFTDDQETSFQGIRDVQGASQPYFGAQTNLINRSTQGPSAARTAQYMNPYTQNVIDIQQRELGRQGEQERQKIGAGAANAGSFGGSRQAILEAEQMRNQGMRGDDIQARGMNQAYGQAQQAMSQADARGLQGAGMYGQMATQIPAQRMKELGALSGVGSALQQQQQRGLDLGFEQFQDEYNFPMKNLNEYSAILRGFPLAADQSTNRYQMSPTAPLSSQLLGAGAGLGSAAMMGGMFGAAGGQVAKLRQGGLAGMYAPSNRVRMGKTNYADGDYPAIGIPKYREDEKEVSIYDSGYEGSIVDRTIDGITNFPSNIAELLYKGASLPVSLVSQALGQGKVDMNNMPGKYYKDFNPRKMTISEYNDMKEKEKGYQDFPTRKGDQEIQDMSEMLKKKEESREKKEVKEEEKATLDERRMRMATYGPLLKNARAIAEAPTLTSALLSGVETAGDVMAGRIAADEAVIGRASAIRGADIAEMAALAGIQKDLSRDALAIEFLKVAQDLSARGDTEGAAKYAASSEALTNNTVDFGGDIRYLKDKDKVLAMIAAAGDTEAPIPLMFKEGGRVGGTPERSFDFIPKDGKLIAVPKQELP